MIIFLPFDHCFKMFLSFNNNREDAAFVVKTSSASVREKTKTPLQRMLIGSVITIKMK
jgi:hypothetical protein